MLSLVLSSAVRAQDPPKTTSETIKDKASGAVGSIKKGALSAEEAIKNQYNKAKDAVVGMGIEGRRLSRLHWDKSLHGTKIELHAPKPGVIELAGTVADAKARARGRGTDDRDARSHRGRRPPDRAVRHERPPPRSRDRHQCVRILRNDDGPAHPLHKEAQARRVCVQPAERSDVSRRRSRRRWRVPGRCRSDRRSCACPSGAARSNGRGAAARGGG